MSALLLLVYLVSLGIAPACPVCGADLLQRHTAPYPCANEKVTHYCEPRDDGLLHPVGRLAPGQILEMPGTYWTAGEAE